MKFRFVRYLKEIYLVVGIGYDNRFECPEHFVVVPLERNTSLFRTALDITTINIPFSQAIEITNKNTLLSLMVLYG